jgi:hypothetical protein
VVVGAPRRHVRCDAARKNAIGLLLHPQADTMEKMRRKMGGGEKDVSCFEC